MSRSLVIRLAARVIVFAGLSVAISLAFAWAAANVPAIAWLVGLASLAILGWTVYQLLRSPRPLPAAMLTGAAAVLALLMALVIDNATEPSVASARPDGTVVATADAGSPSVAPTVAVVGTDASRPTGGPDSAAPTTLAPGTGQPLRLTVASDGVLDRLTIGLDGDVLASTGSDIWLYSLERPGEPVHLSLAGGAVTVVEQPAGTTVTPTVAGSDLTVEVTPAGGGAWSVVRGDTRIPDIGHLSADGTVDTSAAGPLAAELEAALVRIELGVPALAPAAADYVMSLVGRQLLPGTFVLDRRPIGDPSAAATQVVFAVAPPTLSQTGGTDPTTGVWFTATGRLTCSAGSCTAADDLVFPIDAALAILDHPDQLVLSALPDGDHLGVATTCTDVTAVPDGGPTPGPTCWLPDGRPTVLERPSIGDRLELAATSDAPDPDRIEPPE